jgi:hypothetical protein
MNILFIGDIVGSVGRDALASVLPRLKRKYDPTFILVNGENAANGKGITGAIAKGFFELGAHAISMGNHTWDNKDIYEFIDQEVRIVRPANYPPGTPGRGIVTIKAQGKQLTLINLQGRTFLPALDCPFRTAGALLADLPKNTGPIIVDFHAEATSEKIAMGWYLDGKVAAVLGTHTHVQSHDQRILPRGTAYVTDVGMVGPRDGVLGMEKDAVLRKFLTQMPVKFEVDKGKWHFHAVNIQWDEKNGSSRRIELIRIEEDDANLE